MLFRSRPKGEGWNKVIPTNTYTIHNPHGPPVSRGMHSADSKIPLTITAAEFLQVSVERKVELFLCNNYNGVDSLKKYIVSLKKKIKE